MKLSQVERLLYELCVDGGFCLPPGEYARLEKLRTAGIDAFTDAVLRAEGFDPKLEKKMRRGVRDVVAKYFRVCELWWSESQRSYSFFPEDSLSGRGSLKPDAILKWKIEAISWADACATMHEFLGPEAYVEDLHDGDDWPV